MTFEEWMLANFFCEPNWDTPENKLQQSYARLAWDYQQQRIVDLVKQLETAYDHGYANGYTDGKQDAQEQE